MTLTNRGHSLIAVAAALLVTQAADAVTVRKVAIITAQQSGTDSSGFGCGVFEIDTDANVVSYRVSFGGLSSAETVSHFHGPADPGESAGILEGLPLGNPKVGVWEYEEEIEADLLAGRVYLNIHSANNPGGEIRGQLVDMVAWINGDQENPAVDTPAQGFGLFNIDTCTNELSYHIEFEDLSAAESAAHIHGFTLHDANAGVLHPLPAGSPKTGTWSYTEAQEQRILDGQTYVNIHSMAHGGGEIRGQVTRYVVPIDGLQEPAAVKTPGHGCGLIAIDRAADALSYYIDWANLTGNATAAHIHGFAPAGMNAGVQHTIGTAIPAVDSWDYGANEASVLGELTYINVHTAMHGGGEIRGQITFPPDPCSADVDCNQVVDVDDLVAVILAWGTSNPDTDVNNDGTTNVDDLVAVILAWGPCP